MGSNLIMKDRAFTVSSDNIINLYRSIPDYSEISHFSTSEFINKVESLKVEYRHCRQNILDDLETLTNQTESKLRITDDAQEIDDIARNLNIYQDTERMLSIHTCKLHLPEKLEGYYGTKDISKVQDAPKKFSKPQSFPTVTVDRDYYHLRRTTASISSEGECSLPPYEPPKEQQHQLSLHSRESEVEVSNLSRSSSDSALDERTRLKSWDQHLFKFKTRQSPCRKHGEVVTVGKAVNENSVMFRANPVPEHVTKPLFHRIMLQNHKRSERIRQRRKKELISSMKPFSFTEGPPRRNYELCRSWKRPCQMNEQDHSPSSPIMVNNPQQKKQRKKGTVPRLSASHKKNYGRGGALLFRAKPAPPRHRALLAAVRLKEQQEYRQLKKRLRSEELLKNAALPPRMAARERRFISNHAPAQSQCSSARLTKIKDKSFHHKKNEINLDSDDTYDEDELDMISKASDILQRERTSRNYRLSKTSNLDVRDCSETRDVALTTSMDNIASRLRVKSVKEKEEAVKKKEQEELLRTIKTEEKQQKLRFAHLAAWKHAHSYSASQDIALRKQLRLAAAILEKDAYIRNMNMMFNRVQSAPLLLEGIRERRIEPCKKHKNESLQCSETGGASTSRITRLVGSPSKSYIEVQSHETRDHSNSGDNESDDGDKSETHAVAEGSSSESDNQSIKDEQNDPAL